MLVNIFRTGYLGMVTLTNETQTVLSFPRIFKFNEFEFN